MSVVGFDFGCETCVVAVARRRGIDVLQNEIGSRKTPTLVGFGSQQRFIGSEATAQYMSNYKNTFTFTKRFLGREFNDPSMASELKFVPYKVVNLNDMAAFEADYDGKKEVFRPEQVTAAMLQKLKQIAEKGLEGQRVVDCVLGVPSYWNDCQRRSMLDAAHIAGLNVLRLMNETTAVALNYGILRPLPQDTDNKVLFLDIGMSSTTASVVSFVQGKLTVLSTAFDANLGGRDFDQVLVDHFAAYIKDKYKMDVLSNAKATLKLYKECERVKKILSANSTVVFNVEYIMNDTDVKGEIVRADFEKMARDVIMPRVNAVIKEALDRSGLSPADLHSCEIVGGATRIPIVQQALAEYIGKECSKTCDADESVARGCALQCAMLSPAFRVREFEVQDTCPYAIEVQWGPVADANGSAPVEQTAPLFTVNNSIPSVKMISFKDRVKPFQIEAKYEKPDIVGQQCNPVLGRFVVSGMKEVAEGEKPPKIKVKVRLNLHGVCEVASAQALHVIEDEEMKPVEDAAAAPPAAAADDDAQDQAKSSMDTSEDTKAEEAPPAAEAAADSAEAPASEEPKPAEEKPAEEKAAEKPAEPPAEKKQKVRREELTVTPYLSSGLNKPTLQQCFERESAMALSDKVVFETNEARNGLESYCLEMRSRVEDDLAKFVPDSEREVFLKKCTDFEDWLYEDGEDAQKSEYKAKLAELAKVGDAAVRREYETAHRDAEIQALKSAVGHWEQLAGSVDEKYSHIEEEQRQKVRDACRGADTWLSSKLSEQDKLPVSVDPALTCEALRKETTKLTKESGKIMNKAKPPPPKPKEPEKPAEEAKPTEEEAPKDASGDAEMAPPAGEEAAAPADGAPAPEAAADPADPNGPAGMEMD